jgi:plastocyanin
MKMIWLLSGVLCTITLQAAEHQVAVYENRFEPEVIVTNPGDTITWQVVSGRHQLSSHDNPVGLSFTSPVLSPGSQFSVEVVSEEALEVTYGSSANQGLTGALVIEAPSVVYQIDQSINAHYYNPATPGQGLLLEYIPSSNQVLAYWFTFDNTQQQRWMLGTGTPAGHQVTLEMIATTGGQLNDDQAINTVPWGELTLEFKDCQTGQAHYNAREEQSSGSFPLQRLYLAELCP